MKRKLFSRCMAAAILLCALAGVAVKMGVFQGRLGLYQLRYFTTLSNLLAAGCAGWVLARGRRGYAGFKGLAVLCTLVTAVVYHTLLNNTFGGFTPVSLEWWGNQLVHTVVPVLTVLDCLLLDEKGRLRRYHPLVWLLAPCGYFAVTVAFARAGICFPNSATPYPYPFLDVWSLGWGPVLRNVALLAAGFFILGYLLFAIDRLLGKVKTSGAV